MEDFAFVDRIIDLEPGKSISAERTWPTEAVLYDSHFPGFPVVPGVLIAEMMQQAGALCLEAGYPDFGKAILLQIKQASFRGWIKPGDTLKATVVVSQVSRATSKMHCEAHRAGKLVAQSDVVSSWVSWQSVGLEPTHPLLRKYWGEQAQMDSPPHGDSRTPD